MRAQTQSGGAPLRLAQTMQMDNTSGRAIFDSDPEGNKECARHVRQWSSDQCVTASPYIRRLLPWGPRFRRDLRPPANLRRSPTTSRNLEISVQIPVISTSDPSSRFLGPGRARYREVPNLQPPTAPCDRYQCEHPHGGVKSRVTSEPLSRHPGFRATTATSPARFPVGNPNLVSYDTCLIGSSLKSGALDHRVSANFVGYTYWIS